MIAPRGLRALRRLQALNNLVPALHHHRVLSNSSNGWSPFTRESLTPRLRRSRYDSCKILPVPYTECVVDRTYPDAGPAADSGRFNNEPLYRTSNPWPNRHRSSFQSSREHLYSDQPRHQTVDPGTTPPLNSIHVHHANTRETRTSETCKSSTPIS